MSLPADRNEHAASSANACMQVEDKKKMQVVAPSALTIDFMPREA